MLKYNYDDNIKHKNYYSQLESYIRKLESDIKYYIKTYFHYKIKINSLEEKINDYIEMEEEFEELKTKVKYDDGKFLENDRKDNEIMILKMENSNLKNDIIKLEQKNKIYEKNFQKNKDTIDKLKKEIKQLNIKFFDINKNNRNDNNNSSRNISLRVTNRKLLIKNNITVKTLYKNKNARFYSSTYNLFNPKPENTNNILIRCLNLNKDKLDKLEKKQSNSVLIRNSQDIKSDNKKSNPINAKPNNCRKSAKSFYGLGGTWSNKNRKNYS